MDFRSAEKPEGEGGLQYHIACRPGDLERYVLLPGDPARVLKIMALWDRGREIAFHREYRSATGTYKGTGISACSTGIGSPSTAIAVEEMANIGCDTFIRVGSCGAIQEGIECGDLIIDAAAVRMEGTTEQYVRAEYPAYASYEVVLALIEACESLNLRYHLGITASTDSFYLGQGRRGYRNYSTSASERLVEDLRRARVTNFEMEASALFVLSSIYSMRAGCVCTVFADRLGNTFKTEGEETAAKAACEAVRILKEWDDLKKSKGKKNFFPSMR
jgi:uridine phosphorylase